LICADVTDGLRCLPDVSVDAIVTDPPYELGFMGKKWDASGIAASVELWREALRVLKPGAHLLAFGGTRTYHRMTCAIEDAGFEIRDCIQWIYGSGFPKSLDVSKAIDKAAGATRTEVVGTKLGRPGMAKDGANQSFDSSVNTYGRGGVLSSDITAPATDEARQWNGWGTALKPACEPIVVARKPLIGTVAENVLEHGTGALNIDACRIEGTKPIVRPIDSDSRWPANVALDEEAAAMLDEQSGELTSGNNPAVRHTPKTGDIYGLGFGDQCGVRRATDSGGASRFFYTAKADRTERNDGLEEFDARTTDDGRETSIDNPFLRGETKRRNHHPTVKPIALMRWLVRLITPPNGVVLDPFVGSGSTGCAAIGEGFNFIGIDREVEYIEIARARIRNIAPLFAREEASA